MAHSHDHHHHDDASNHHHEDEDSSHHGGHNMTNQDWLDEWEKSEQWEHSVVDQFLIKYINKLTEGNKQSNILVPLCGTSVDLKWLAEQGYKVVGVELSPVALKKFLTDHQLEHKVTTTNNGATIYEAFEGNLKLVVSDFFLFSKDAFGTFDCIWDLNAFDPINKGDKQRYADQCHSLLKPNGHILLGNYIFDDHFCGELPVTMDTLQMIYGGNFTVEHLELTDITNLLIDGFKDDEWKPNKIEETIFFMTRKS